MQYRPVLGLAAKVVGFVVGISAVPIWNDGSPLLAVVAFVVGVGLVFAGSIWQPAAKTGAHTARFMMETMNDLHMVKPPGENVLDPIEGDTQSRFNGR